MMNSEFTPEQIKNANELAMLDAKNGRRIGEQNSIPSLSSAGMGSQSAPPPKQNFSSDQKRNNAALQTVKDIGSKVAGGLAYPGQVVKGTFDQVAKGIQNLPQNMKNYDKSYGNRVRSDLAQINKTGGGTAFPTPMNPAQPQATQASVIPPPVMTNNPMPPVDVVNNNYATNGAQPQTFNNKDVNNIMAQSPPAGGQPQTIPATPQQLTEGPQMPPLPQNNALPANPEFQANGVPRFGNEYAQNNYKGLNDKTKNEERFMKNMNDAKLQDAASQDMVNRINRGTEAMKELSQARNAGGMTMANADFAPKKRETNTERPGTLEWAARQKELKLGLEDRNMDIEQQENERSNAIAQERGTLDRSQLFLDAKNDQFSRMTEGKQQTFENEMTSNKYNLDKTKAMQAQINKSAEYDANPDNYFGKALNNTDYTSRYEAALKSGDEGQLERFNQLAAKKGWPNAELMQQYLQNKAI